MSTIKRLPSANYCIIQFDQVLAAGALKRTNLKLQNYDKSVPRFLREIFILAVAFHENNFSVFTSPLLLQLTLKICQVRLKFKLIICGLIFEV